MNERLVVSILALMLFLPVVTVVATEGQSENFLVIHTMLRVTEGELFPVFVTDNESRSIENATVVFLNETYNTSRWGWLTLQAPMVDQNTDFIIIANKTGYLNATARITVENELLIPELSIDSIVILMLLPASIIHIRGMV